MTTMVGFSIAGSCITRAAKQVMVMLLPLPWVCQTTPPLPRSWRGLSARRGHHLRNGRAHRVELVVAGDLLDQLAVVLEQHEVAQVVQQVGRRQRASHQRLQLVELAQRVERVAVDGAPLHEALAVGRERTQRASLPSDMTSTSLYWKMSGICAL
jgi:hypothetical protein